MAVYDVFLRVGGEKVLLLSAAAWGSMTAFTPVLAHFCSQPIFSMTLSRFLMGLLQGETDGFRKRKGVGSVQNLRLLLGHTITQRVLLLKIKLLKGWNAKTAAFHQIDSRSSWCLCHCHTFFYCVIYEMIPNFENILGAKYEFRTHLRGII